MEDTTVTTFTLPSKNGKCGHKNTQPILDGDGGTMSDNTTQCPECGYRGGLETKKRSEKL